MSILELWDETTAREERQRRKAKKKGAEEECVRVMLILFVEYHRAFRESATYTFDREADLTVVAQGGSVAEGRKKMAEGGIDTAIVDIPLPDEGAPEMVRELHKANPSIPVLVLTA